MASIAIIGSGISGMGTAHLLHKNHTITLYEKNAITGGHTRTKTVDYDGVSIPVDTGFIVYNERNYPNLIGLFAELHVPTHESNMTFAATINRGAFEWCARDLNGMFGQRRNLLSPAFYRMLRDVIRFNRSARAMVDDVPDITLGALVASLGLSEAFLRNYLLPMGGAIWSCPTATMLEFPARSFIRFFENHGLLAFSGQPQWRTVTGGSQEYMRRLIAPFQHHIRTDCAVVAVRRESDGVYVRDVRGEEIRYDRVVFASHADETLAMLSDASDDERRILGAFTYQTNHAYLHRDTRVMPKRKRCWASWVYHADTLGDTPHIAVTYWMNLLQGIDHQKPLFVTLNPLHEIPKDKLFDHHVFTHPVFTREAMAAQAQLPSLQGAQQCWFAGAYTRYGFHEDGLTSAVNVARSMGETIPWA